MALWAIAALFAGAAEAQEPKSPVLPRRTQLALAIPDPAMAAARLSGMFDAAALHRPLPGSVILAPRRALNPSFTAPIPVSPRPSLSKLHQALVVPVPLETPEYRRTFNRLLSQPERTDRYDNLILKYARMYGLDARFLKSIMAAESEFRSDAVSPAGARGLMQVMPRTAATFGVSADDLYDAESGLRAGAAYIHQLFQMAWRRFHLRGVRYTDVPAWVMQRVIAAYHAGPKFLTRTHWYASTRAYVRKVVLYYASKVTDLRRPVAPLHELPSFAEAAAPGGTLY